MTRAITVDCPLCGGEGVVPSPDGDGFLDEPCPLCGGDGWIDVTEKEDGTPSELSS